MFRKVLLFSCFLPLLLFAQTYNNVTFFSDIPLGNQGVSNSTFLGNLGYLSTGYPSYIYDFSDPLTPELKYTFQTDYAGYDAAIDGDKLYTVGYDGVGIFDISNPVEPVLIGTFTTIINTIGVIEVKDNYVYLAGSVGGSPTVNSGLWIYDVSVPSAPVLIKYIYIIAARDVVINENYAYVAHVGSTGGGVTIVDISNEAQAYIINEFPMGTAYHLEILNDKMFVSYFDGILIADISTPEYPETITAFQTTTSHLNDFAVDDKYIYTANEAEGLKIFEYSNSFEITLQGSYLNLPFKVYTVNLFEDKMIVYEIGDVTTNKTWIWNNKILQFDLVAATRISVGSEIGYIGESVLVPIDLEIPANKSFSAFEITISGFQDDIDFTGLELVGTLMGNPAWTSVVNDTDSALYIAFAGSTSVSTDGVLCNLNFDIPLSAVPGNVPLNIDYAICDNGATPTLTFDGSVEVKLRSPELISPPDNDILRVVDFDLNWNSSTAAEYYKVQVDNDSLFGSPEYDNIVPDTSYSVVDILNGHDYWWRVAAKRGEYLSGWSTVRKFTVELIPTYGEVDINGTIQAYDASLILKYLVQLLNLSQQQKLNADVTLDGTVSALDATVILQYVVHIINQLPYTPPAPAIGQIVFTDQSISPGAEIEVPVRLTGLKELYAVSGSLNFDLSYLEFVSAKWDEGSGIEYYEINLNEGSLKFAGAALNPINSDEINLILTFRVKDELPGEATQISFENFRLNENELIPEAGRINLDVVSSVNNNPEIPEVFCLLQNYPNPFNPTTNIRFGTPEGADVSLIIYDVLGNNVAEIVKGYYNAGYYTISFNASELSSGIYFCEMVAGDFRSVMKIMLMK